MVGVKVVMLVVQSAGLSVACLAYSLVALKAEMSVVGWVGCLVVSMVG